MPIRQPQQIFIQHPQQQQQQYKPAHMIPAMPQNINQANQQYRVNFSVSPQGSITQSPQTGFRSQQVHQGKPVGPVMGFRMWSIIKSYF